MPNWEAVTRRIARRKGVDPNLFAAQIGQESHFDPNARSGAGAEGIAQFMPDTARGLGIDPMRPRQALRGAASLMHDYIAKYGVEGALRAYNAGPGNIQKSHGFGETNNYVKSILGQAGHSPGITGASVTPVGVSPMPLQQFAAPNVFETIANLNSMRDSTAMDPLQNQLQQGWELLASLQQSRNQDTGGDPISRATASLNPSGGGVKAATFDGKPVVSSFIPELTWAKQHGWTGTVTSGIRSKAEQLAAAKNFGLQHYGPAGPLGSNHVEGHQGAVDVTEPDLLEAILRKYPGKRLLRRGMADDPVHFSPTGH
jgi:hypothetical protein